MTQRSKTVTTGRRTKKGANVAEKTPKQRLSRELILTEASQLLLEVSLEEFSLALLAKRLGAGVMSLYTYFPSRDDLLNAVAEHVFGQFEPPPVVSERWQDAFFDRLMAMARFMDRWPSVFFKLQTRNGQHSVPYVRLWWLPMATMLQERGLTGARLAFAASWVSSSVMGLIIAEMQSPHHRKEPAGLQLEGLTLEEQQFMISLWLDLHKTDRYAALEYGFRNIIRGLEALIDAG